MSTPSYGELIKNGMRTPILRPVATMADSDSPIEMITRSIAFQSGFSTKAQYQNLPVQQGAEINLNAVGQGQSHITKAGYGLALAPWSESPVAVQFLSGSASTSAVQVLSPGQIVWPFKTKESTSAFSGFLVGAPIGWLGGGNVCLYVIKSPEADIRWDVRGPKELLIQRIRLQVYEFVDGEITPGLYNWPLQFNQGTTVSETGQTIVGSPSLFVNPTNVLIRIRSATVVGTETFQAIVQDDTILDTDTDGLSITSGKSVTEFYSTPPYNILSGAYPLVVLTGGPLNRVGGRNCRVDFVSTSPHLIGKYFDIERWGTLG